MYCQMKSRGKTIIGIRLLLCTFLLIAVASSTVTAADAAGKPIQSFKFEDEFSIRKALAMLASAYSKNIVPTPAVDGTLAFRGLSNVTFEDAMDAILGSSFRYEQVGNLIRVYTQDEYKKIMEDPARMEYKVFTLYYVTAAEAQNLITPLLSDAADIQVTSPAEKGISSGGGSAPGMSAGGGAPAGGAGAGSSAGGGDTLALHDTIVIYDYPERIEAVRGLLDVIDVRPKQVLIEATILSALLNEGMELGVDWNLAAGVGVSGVASTDTIVAGSTVDRGTTGSTTIGGLKVPGTRQGPGTPIETSGFANEMGNGLRLGITTGDVRVFVTALESITDTTVLANPKIMTVNKQEGSVLIGTNLGYRSSTSIGNGGVATQGEVEFLQTGTQLVFRPYIGDDGYIRMEIYPKDSSATLNADGVPTEQTVQMKTNVIVKDGETIVIGGLFRNVITTTRNQVPLLGDLPLVGGLFRGTSDANQREEVIVLLTTRIVDRPEDLDSKESAEDVRRRTEGAKEELQSISRTKMAEGAYEKAAALYIEGDIESARKQLKIALKLRPAYTEALRLKDKIDAENPPIVTNDESMFEYDGTVEDEGMVVESVEDTEDASWSKK